MGLSDKLKRDSGKIMKQIKATIIQTLRYILYAPLNWIRYLLCMDSTVPVSRQFGLDRGTPIDRYYIDQFLKRHVSYIHGDVLEIAENTYTIRYGTNPVSHVLHAVEGNPNATFVGNLETGENIPQNAYDCIILTQTLPFIYDTRAVIQNSFRALKKGGSILVTVPCISHISRYDMDRWGDFWRFTDMGLRRLFEETFDPEKISIEIFGNVYAAKAFLYGVACEDINLKLLQPVDPDYQVTIGLIAEK